MMRTLASLALLAVGATAQLIDSSSFGAGQTSVQYPCTIFGLRLSDFRPGYHQPETLSPDGQLQQRAMYRKL